MNDKISIHNYKDVVNAIDEALMVVGEDGVIIMANAAMVQLSGFSREELVGSSCTILNCDVCTTGESFNGEKWCYLFQVGKIEDKQCLFMRKNGSYASVIKNASLLKDEHGNIIGALEIFKESSRTPEGKDAADGSCGLFTEKEDFYGMVGNSVVMQQAYDVITKAAGSDAPVIIYGESGTGKELAACAIHQLGARQEGPFIQFNCAALNESLFESELFGHVKGAFTGAVNHRKGRFEAAEGGDIFLDEIGDIPLPIQTKLLRVLETKQFERVGDHRPINADARIISATNRDLKQLMAEDKFREDLFFRINVIPIHLPPLRERKEDIPLLVDTFAEIIRAEDEHAAEGGVGDAVMDLFMHYDWPGNIRELKSALAYAYVIADAGPIEPRHLPPSFFEDPKITDQATYFKGAPADNREEISEKSVLIQALRQSGGNKTQTARILGVHRMTVWNRMRKYGITLSKDVEA